MADNKNGRDKQARDQENRQRRREMLAELERMDELEPDVEEEELDDLEAELEAVTFPATAATIVDAVGDYQIDETHTAADLLPETETESYETPTEVKMRVQRPTIAGAMKQIVEASAETRGVSFGNSQEEAYEKTLRALRAIDADDDDEGVDYMTKWIVEQIREKGKLPGSRAVRREAAKFCRREGYSISNNDWLGI